MSAATKGKKQTAFAKATVRQRKQEFTPQHQRFMDKKKASDEAPPPAASKPGVQHAVASKKTASRGAKDRQRTVKKSKHWLD